MGGMDDDRRGLKGRIFMDHVRRDEGRSFMPFEEIYHLDVAQCWIVGIEGQMFCFLFCFCFVVVVVIGSRTGGLAEHVPGAEEATVREGEEERKGGMELHVDDVTWNWDHTAAFCVCFSFLIRE